MLTATASAAVRDQIAPVSVDDCAEIEIAQRAGIRNAGVARARPGELSTDVGVAEDT